MYSSPRLWYTLRYFGHDNVSVLDGGLNAWKASNEVTGEVTKVSEETQYKSEIKHRDLLLDSKDVYQNIKSKSFTLYDARANDRFVGLVEEPRKTIFKGNIPNSLNVPFSDLLNTNNGIITMKSKEELLEYFKRRNINYSRDVAVTCGSGLTACILALAFYRVGNKKVKLYDGSWSEWGNKKSLPHNSFENIMA
eukprot:TRINITY_DN472_c0_g1_i2.p1 TRINITY_DN472_c0_g1~~TRINITY_DN472_c0_g1_i2.p1  ORF type:complete len:194 (-),score=61.50 TRINITY_DN472_c0_g1_i2:65-646(-)